MWNLGFRTVSFCVLLIKSVFLYIRITRYRNMESIQNLNQLGLWKLVIHSMERVQIQGKRKYGFLFSKLHGRLFLCLSPSRGRLSLFRIGSSLSKCMSRLWTGPVMDIHQLIDNNNRFVCCLTFKHIFDDIRNFTWVHYIWFYCSVLKDTQDRPYLGLKYHDYSRKLKKLTTYILYLKLAILLNTTVYKFTFHRI